MNDLSASKRGAAGDDQFVDLGGGMRLCYRTAGPASGEPMLLIAGLGLQLTSWPAAFINAFTSAGYRVILPDNRDVGRSSPGRSRPPSRLQQLRRAAPPDNYGIDDMADDMARLLRHLHLGRVHLVGMSMGGMIAQTLASRHPHVVASLTSIFSTTGARAVGQPGPSVLWLFATASAPRSESEAVARFQATMRVIGDASVPGIEAVWADDARLAWQRGGQRANASGVARQIGAVLKSGDRTEQLRRIAAPTLVLHGSVDRMVHPSGGRATADAIAGARLVVIDGMRHQIDTRCSAELAGHIVAHCRQAAVVTSTPVEDARCN